jgi:NhaP-type Na+/H+ or K+/H+ antiporter
VEDVPPIEITLFIVMALVVGGLTMGGVTLVYFLDKWRKDAPPEPARMREEASPFDRAA